MSYKRTLTATLSSVFALGFWSHTALAQDVTIVSVNSGKCMEVADSSTANGANIQQSACTGADNQTWTLESFSTTSAKGLYKIRSKLSGKCADLGNGTPDNGTNVQQWDCVDKANQIWVLRSSSLGEYEVVSIMTKKCLDVSGAQTTDGANIQQWQCVSTEAEGIIPPLQQTWKITVTP